MVQINYFYIVDEVHGRPIAETASSDIQGFKTDFHPLKLADRYSHIFIDILIEDESDIEVNKEAQILKELIDVPLEIIEEIITDQRPRADHYPEFYLILFKCFTSVSDEPITGIREHQVGVLIRGNVIFSLHKEIPSMRITDVFKRFNKYPMKIAKGGLTYFVSSYLDMMIDNIYVVLESWTKKIDFYERKMIEKPKKGFLYDILELKHRLLDLVKILQADREIIHNIKKANLSFFNVKEIPPELDDHIRHLLDEADIIRTLLTDVTNMYYNSESSRLNEIMKRFTFLTSLILLPSLMAGIFGMNNFPNDPASFITVILSMLIFVSGLFGYFKFKRYI